MMDTTLIILWIIWTTFLVVMIIMSEITERRERKKRLKEWAEFEAVFKATFEEKEEEIEHETSSPILDYKPVCPRGYEDCVYDPAYIKYHHPEWYKSIYGDMTPEEAVNAPTGCKDKVEEDPEERYYCYDDEDKDK